MADEFVGGQRSAAAYDGLAGYADGNITPDGASTTTVGIWVGLRKLALIKNYDFPNKPAFFKLTFGIPSININQLIKAFERNDIDPLRQYIADGGNPNATQDFISRSNVTILTCAALCLFSDAVEYLLSVGANPNIQETAGKRGVGGGTALHWAIVGSNSEPPGLKEERRVKIVDMLLKAGADPNAVLGGSELPLYFAARSCLVKVTQRLIEGGALAKGLPEGCISPLIGAAGKFPWAKAESERIIHLLFDHGAAVDGETAGHETPLMAAANQGAESLVELFLKRGANVNCRATKDGRMPLICIAMYFRRDALNEERQQLALRIPNGCWRQELIPRFGT